MYPMHNLTLKPDAEWTDDCQGKKDYDANVLRIDTRYWPRGGGYHVMTHPGSEWQGNEARPEIPPSAHSNLLLRCSDREITLLESDFKAETEAEVKAMVEAWCQAAFEQLTERLLRLYPDAKEN